MLNTHGRRRNLRRCYTRCYTDHAHLVVGRTTEVSDTPYMIALMIAILTIGITVDAVFSTIERGIRRRRGVVLRG